MLDGGDQGPREARPASRSRRRLLNDPEALRKFQAGAGPALGRAEPAARHRRALSRAEVNQNFLALQSQLEGTENRIAVERRRFNEAVREYNTRLRLFPGSFVARCAGFREKAFFEAAPGAATPPKVKF